MRKKFGVFLAVALMFSASGCTFLNFGNSGDSSQSDNSGTVEKIELPDYDAIKADKQRPPKT